MKEMATIGEEKSFSLDYLIVHIFLALFSEKPSVCSYSHKTALQSEGKKNKQENTFIQLHCNNFMVLLLKSPICDRFGED